MTLRRPLTTLGAQYSGAAGKRHRLREGKVWIDPPAYYDPPGGLLVFEPRVPRALIYPKGGMTVNGHVELINHQLRQLRSALAVAHALGRKLILPSFVCGYDKAWCATLRPPVPRHRGRPTRALAP